MTHTLRRHARALAGLAATVALAAPAAAGAQATMTFQPAACAAGTAATLGDSYAEAGFRLTATPRLVTWCADSPHHAGPGAYIGADIINLAPGLAGPLDGKLYRETGPAAFRVHSIDLAQLVSGMLPAQTITFTGRQVGGAVVTQSFELAAQAGQAAFQTFTFDAQLFTNLETLYFPAPGFQGYQFTDIVLGESVVSTAPEPSTTVLAATGVLAAGLVARRRRRAA